MLISCHFRDCKALLSNGKKCYSKCWPLPLVSLIYMEEIALAHRAKLSLSLNPLQLSTLAERKQGNDLQ